MTTTGKSIKDGKKGQPYFVLFFLMAVLVVLVLVVCVCKKSNVCSVP